MGACPSVITDLFNSFTNLFATTTGSSSSSATVVNASDAIMLDEKQKADDIVIVNGRQIRSKGAKTGGMILASSAVVQEKAYWEIKISFANEQDKINLTADDYISIGVSQRIRKDQSSLFSFPIGAEELVNRSWGIKINGNELNRDHIYGIKLDQSANPTIFISLNGNQIQEIRNIKGTVYPAFSVHGDQIILEPVFSDKEFKHLVTNESASGIRDFRGM